MLRPRDSSSLFFFWLASSAPFLDRTRRGNAQTHAAGEALVFPRPVNVFLRPGGEWRGVHGGGKHPSLNLSSPLFLLLLLLLLLSLFFFRGRGSCDQNAIYRTCLRFSSSPVLRERFFSSFEKEPRSPSLLSLSLSLDPHQITSLPLHQSPPHQNQKHSRSSPAPSASSTTGPRALSPTPGKRRAAATRATPGSGTRASPART